MYELFIANKNYSSWSLRPWVLMKALGIPFAEQMIPFASPEENRLAFLKFSPSGKVPCLLDGETTVWDLLAIAEYLHERHPGVWPTDMRARAWARCAAAEMHSGFATLRNTCGMNCGVRVKLNAISPELQRDVSRISELWNDGLTRFSGPFLAGRNFTNADAMFCPVAYRVQSYGLPIDGGAPDYVQTLLDVPAMQEWYKEALAETWRIERYENDARTVGTVTEDFRAAA